MERRRRSPDGFIIALRHRGTNTHDPRALESQGHYRGDNRNRESRHPRNQDVEEEGDRKN